MGPRGDDATDRAFISDACRFKNMSRACDKDLFRIIHGNTMLHPDASYPHEKLHIDFPHTAKVTSEMPDHEIRPRANWNMKSTTELRVFLLYLQTRPLEALEESWPYHPKHRACPRGTA